LAEQVIRKKLGEHITSDDIAILELPTKLFDPYRILIMKILYTHLAADFRQLRHDLRTPEGKEITDGNLASHLKALCDAGYVSFEKTYVENKPRTVYCLTQKGLSGFQQFAKYLAKVVQSGIEV
jgi:DNA-binding HxlR family transcriptional regulator